MDAIFFGSFICLSLLAFFLHRNSQKSSRPEEKLKEDKEKRDKFTAFQRKFFLAYFLALLSDWLQGPYVYKLYEYYGYQEFQIAVLYTAGFASSVLFGTFTGPIADVWGRKRMALIYCIFYIICCLTKLSSSFFMLMIGRIFGGIATSVLFSTFEAWYVYEHTNNEFPQEWTSETFSISTFFNGLLAICAGIIANFAAETMGMGPVSPFIVALLPLTACLAIVQLTWSENYGSRSNTHLGSSCAEGLSQIFANKSVFYLGIVQSAVESILYIFVFLWTPILSSLQPPLGIIFADFMICIMIGSKIYGILLDKYSLQNKDILKVVCLTLAGSLFVCQIALSPVQNNVCLVIIFFAFCTLETALGIYFPAMSFLKSKLVPESHRANIMNWFRVPLNIITCGTLLSLKSPTIKNDKRIVLGFCMVLALLGYLGTENIEAKDENNKEEREKLLEVKT